MLVLVSLLLEIGDDLIGYKDAVTIVTGIALPWSQHLQEAYIPAALRHSEPPIAFQGVRLRFNDADGVFDLCAVNEDWFSIAHFCLFAFGKRCRAAQETQKLHCTAGPHHPMRKLGS